MRRAGIVLIIDYEIVLPVDISQFTVFLYTRSLFKKAESLFIRRRHYYVALKTTTDRAAIRKIGKTKIKEQVKRASAEKV